MDTYEIVSEVRGMERFLVVYHENEEFLNEYLLKMIEYNQIAGILPLKSQNRNGKTLLNYRLGEKFKLIDLIQQNEVDQEGTKVIYTRLIDALIKMEEYFLNADQLLYDLNYLYVDPTLNPYLIYLPFENIRNQEMDRVWREFFLNLLSYLADGKRDAFYDNLMRYLIQPKFQIKKFRELLMEHSAESRYQVSSVKEQMVQTASTEESVPILSKETLPNQGKALGGLSVPGFKGNKSNFAIPGKSESFAVSEEKTETQTNEKKRFPFLDFGKKKEKAEKNKKPEKNKKLEKNKKPEIALPKPEIALPPSARNKGTSYEQEQKESIAVKEEQAGQSDWSNTHYYKTLLEESVTVLASEENATMMLEGAHLMCQGVYIPISQFPFTIGKASASYIVANPTVSRLHATISRQGDQYYITDEQSKNHTYVNGTLIPPKTFVELHEGDQLRLSNEEFTFHIR